MTQEEALEIIANAKPIVLPKSGTTTSINDKKIMNFKDLFKKNGNSRRKESKTCSEES